MEDSAICSIVNGDNPVDWPDIAEQPINEFHTPWSSFMGIPNMVLEILHIQDASVKSSMARKSHPTISIGDLQIIHVSYIGS